MAFTYTVYYALPCAFAMLLHYLVITFAVNPVAPHRYMDEIFHADQMLAYCDGNFSYWNDKITTPPGLYLLSLPLVHFAAVFTGEMPLEFCADIRNLRWLNVIWIGAFVVTVLWTLNQDRQPKTKSRSSDMLRCVMSALCIAHMPVLWQTSWLYYTDLPCAVFLLLGYGLCERSAYTFSAIALLISCLLRQSAIIWLLFCFGLAAVRDVATPVLLGSVHNKEIASDQRLIRAVMNVRFWCPSKLPLLVERLLCVCFGYLSAIAVFVGAVLYNCGLALGDKSAHQAVLHLVQIHYCTVFLLVMGAPILLHPKFVLQTVSSFRPRFKHCIFLAIFAMLTFVAVNNFTMAHPYLLADNRHYTFYIWRRWFMRHPACKYMLIPIYTLGASLIAASIKHKSVIWKLGFATAWCLAAVPNRLLEFRYFVPAYLLWRLHARSKLSNAFSLIAEFIWLSVINLVTVWLFVNRPFMWPSEPHRTQRFIW